MDRELDLRLQEIRARIVQVDPLLARIVNVVVRSSASVQYGLALRLAGATVRGIPFSSSATGKSLDEATRNSFRVMQAMDISAGGDGKQWSDFVRELKEARLFEEEAKADDERFKKVVDQLGDQDFTDVIDLADREGKLADDAAIAFSPPKAVTLVAATVYTDSGGTEQVDNLRVNLSSVEAWWIFELGVPDQAQDAYKALKDEEGNGF